MFGASIGRGGQRIIDAMVRWLARGHISPNMLTFIGVAINVVSAMLFGFGRFFWAGIVLIVANLFDMLDGNVALVTGATRGIKLWRIFGFVARSPVGHGGVCRVDGFLCPRH